MSNEFHRKYCLKWHAESVRRGYFHAARRMLRSALKFKKGGRVASLAVDYGFHNGVLLWYHWGN